MKIIEYIYIYIDDVRNLLTELGEYLASLDKDDLQLIHPDYRKKLASLDLKDVRKRKGKCYLALENGKVVGLIMGVTRKYNKYDYLDYKCPKEGVITELIVSSKARSKGIGKALITKMEDYFKSIGCEYVLLDVFAYNENAIGFYRKMGYHPRMYTDIKKL